MRTSLLLLPLMLSGFLSAAESKDRLVRETEPLTAEKERAALHVPPGFEVQLFASEPMINKPINMAFDARGRLWVSSTVEYPYSADKSRWSDAEGTRVKDSRDAIKILEDTDGDGRADKVTDFADGLNIPTGVVPWHKPEHKAGCIAWSIPNIWYFADTDGDDKADVRQILFGPLGYEKDTHGMCSSFRLGLDGWVYATHGFNNTSRFEVRSGEMTNSRMTNDEKPNPQTPSSFGNSSFDIPGRRLELHSGNVFRFRPDGSNVEPFTRGQVNPFGLCWDRYGNLYSADCHSSPIYQLIRGAHYPSFGKPHDGLGFAPVMCEHTHGSTGICGIVYLDGGVWGPEWDDHMLVGNPVTSKVNRDLVTFTGSTPKANERPDFITSDDPWFRPVDLQLGPDNALYLADFYNRIIGHYEVPLDHKGRDKERGRIWRVVKKGAAAKRPAAVAAVPVSVEALKSASPRMRPIIAARLQEHLELRALPVLIDELRSADPKDETWTHLLKVLIREHLKLEDAFAHLGETSVSEDLISSIALAVPTEASADFLFARLAAGQKIDGVTLKHISRHGRPELTRQTISWARQNKRPDAPSQVELITAISDGLSERGSPMPPELLSWAQQQAEAMLMELAKKPQASWTAVASAKTPVWTLKTRKCADGTEAQVLQSMSTGGGEEESRTGILRSKDFAAPNQLSVWVNGHNGLPKGKSNDKNLIRVVDAKDGAVLAKVFPPRNDVCQLMKMDLSKHAGRQVRLEMVDGDDGKAYAWLGITRIEPPVVSVEDFQTEDTLREDLKKLAVILQHSAPAALREKLAAYLPPRPAPPPLPVSPEQRKQLDALITARVAAFAKAKSDIAKGKQVFQTNCAVCHRIGGEGGLIGPQLDGIGTRGAARLSEDILDPNRNVDAHFHVHTFTLKDGAVFSGFLKAEAGQVNVLVDAAGKEHRVTKKDVEKSAVMPMSLMPPVFGQTMDEASFHHLLGYLLGK